MSSLIFRDHDGIPDEYDNCPLHADTQHLDTDGDGKGERANQFILSYY